MVCIIAEIGVNHNGSLDEAKRLIEAAATSKADYVKFQLFNSDLMCTKRTQLAKYQLKSSDSNESMHGLLKKLELSADQILILKEYCQKCNINFLCTSFDEESTIFLKSIGQDVWKIPSGEINNAPYLELISSSARKIFLSTGMSDVEDIDNALEIILNKKISMKDITLLHCTSEYPTAFENANLNSINFMKKRYDCQIGYSDHTLGNLAAIISVAFGANLIEKHITLDNSAKGPDHMASLNVKDLPEFINDCKRAELSLGEYTKKPTNEELITRSLVRKSIVAKKKINKGEKFTIDNITTKRPGDGLSPIKWQKIIGKTSNQNYEIDQQIKSN